MIITHYSFNDGRIYYILSTPTCFPCLKTVQRFPVPLEGMHHVLRRNRLPARVLGVRDRVPDHVLEEDFEAAPGLFVDQTVDALDPTPAREPANGRFGDPLDIPPPIFAVAFRAALPASLARFAASLARPVRTELRLELCHFF